MNIEKGVIIVAYKNSNARKRYLLLKRKKNWEGWEIPKGHLEEDDYRKTVKIELNEEAGIKEKMIKNIEDLDKTVEWSYQQEGKKFKKEYKAFAAEIKEEAHVDTSQNPDEEHEKGYFFNLRDGKALLEYENNIKLLEEFEEKR